MKYILTINSQSTKKFLNLIKKDEATHIIKWLDDEVCLCEYFGIQPLHDIILTSNYYVRHIFKIDEILSFENAIIDLTTYSQKYLDKLLSFSFQIRKSKNCNFDNSKIIEIATNLEKNGYVLNVKNPQQIISIFISDENIFVGIGNKKTNLSKFKGGMYHFSNDKNFVSRAEYKLLEAYDCFGLDWSKSKFAIDLGASPGGWSKVLADHSEKVYAIDPAHLDPKVLNLKNVSHYKMTAQEFLKANIDVKFDILVNDMKMDIPESIEITKSLKPYLSLNADIILTLKLPHEHSLLDINNAISNLKNTYKIIAIRQLFHNRSELTIYAKNI